MRIISTMTKPKSPTPTQSLNLSLPSETITNLKNLQTKWHAASLSEVVRRLASLAADLAEAGRI